MALVLAVAFVGLLAMGLAIVFVLAGAGAIAVISTGEYPLSLIPAKLYEGLDSFSLLAIPFFMLAGALMNESGMTQRLVAFAQLLVGWIRGGLAQVNIIASMLFAGISGAAAAEAAAIGSVLIPAMKEEGYGDDYAAAVTAAASTMGPIIPPSIPMILYGILANVSIGALFLAGAVPGLLLGLGFMGLAWLTAVRRGYPTHPLFRAGAIWQAFRDALWALIMPVIILGASWAASLPPPRPRRWRRSTPL